MKNNIFILNNNVFSTNYTEYLCVIIEIEEVVLSNVGNLSAYLSFAPNSTINTHI